MWLVVGLGNPGPAYQITRHNVGFMVLDAMAKRLALKGWEEFCQALVLKSEKISLAKPQTFMNLSGQSVSCLARQWQLLPEEILVVHDDLDLPLGRIKIVRSGGSGGHRGVASVIEHLGSRDFPRVKVGIGRPGPGKSVSDYVLSPFEEQELKVVAEIIEKAAEAIETIVESGLERAMNIFNALRPACSL